MKPTKAKVVRGREDDFLACFSEQCALLSEPEPTWIARIRKGLPGGTVLTLARKMGVPQKDIASWLHTTTRTLQRHIETDAKLSPEISDRLAQLMRVYCRCNEVFKHDEKVSTWLKTSNYALGGVTPTSLLDTIPGIEMVLDELGRIEHGIFA